jgi:hypothetical protein
VRLEHIFGKFPGLALPAQRIPAEFEIQMTTSLFLGKLVIAYS